MVKTMGIHLGYFIALFILSFISFFLLFGAGFVGKINTFILFIPFVFSVLWISSYIWYIFRKNLNKLPLFHLTKRWEMISLLFSGIFTVYSLFLTTLILTPIDAAPLWMFLGTPVILLLIWFWLLYTYKKNKSKYTQRVFGSVHFIISLMYTYQICSFYINNT
ncbi:hypothetical protein J2Z40_002863 [Cytobacillus eiseniae]|uniref:Uncharacterized protein n=1 Tax=Cytobacillus eiseniae TaxID=762947 RepID=A0ABS4RHA5_9BACI|nr:hypothetical protein [Cytobacillus eiseniae]